METNTIKDLNTLCEYIKTGKAEFRNFPDKKKILQCEMRRIAQRKPGSRFVLRKKIFIMIPLCRYLLAFRHYRTIISFRSEKLRLSISQAAQKDIPENLAQYQLTYALLDRPSQKIYLNMLLYRLTGDYTLSISSQSTNEQYFSNQISWEKIKTVIDCGAYTGDTLQGFLKQKIAIKNYYLYELDDANYAKMQEVCTLAQSKGIITHPRKKGVYSRSATLYFEADGDSSMLVDYPTDHSISVISIDEDIHEKVDFIKMDIEGSELEALNGASKTINRYKPLLAVCIYHKQQDFWQIPLRIREICPEYKKFWIEQYSPWDIETVLFAEA